MALLKYLTEERQFHDTIDEAKEYLISNGIELGEQLDYYVGSGEMGDVYKVKDTDKVIKIYAGIDEFNAIEKIREYQKSNKTDHVVNYYFNKKTKYEFICVMEYLQSLYQGEYPNEFVSRVIKKFESSYLDKLYESADPQTVIDKLILRGIPEGYHDDIKQSFENLEREFRGEQHLFEVFVMSYYANVGTFNIDVMESVLKFVEKNPKLFIHLLRGIKQIEKMGTEHGDIHRNNILKDPKTGNYKLIDPYPIDFM